MKDAQVGFKQIRLRIVALGLGSWKRSFLRSLLRLISDKETRTRF